MSHKSRSAPDMFTADLGQLSLGFTRERIEGCIATLTPDSEAWSIAHIAAAGSIEVARMLVAGSCNLNACNPAGKTLLHMAAHRGDIDLLALLIEASADIHVGDIEGLTPLDIGAIAGHAEVVERLIAAGADFMKEADNGQRVVDWATGEAQVVLRRHTLDALAKQ